MNVLLSMVFSLMEMATATVKVINTFSFISISFI